MDELSNTEFGVILAGALALILTALEKAIPATRKYLPIGGSDFAQLAILFMLAIGTAQLQDAVRQGAAKSMSGSDERRGQLSTPQP